MNLPHQYPRFGVNHDRKETKVEHALGSGYTYISKEDLKLLRRDSQNLSSLVRSLHGFDMRITLTAGQYHKLVRIAKTLKLDADPTRA